MISILFRREIRLFNGLFFLKKFTRKQYENVGIMAKKPRSVGFSVLQYIYSNYPKMYV